MAGIILISLHIAVEMQHTRLKRERGFHGLNPTNVVAILVVTS